MTSPKKLLALALLALAGCQAENRSSVHILGRAAPSSDVDCTYAAGGEFQLGTGVLDVGPTFAGFLRYRLPIYVNNAMIAPSDSSSATIDSAKAWRVETAKVRVNPSSYIKDYRPSPALAPFSAENVVPAEGQAIPPDGESVVFVTVVSHELGVMLQNVAVPGELRTVVLGITLQGRTNDGQFLETGEWYYPIELCVDCLVGPAACPIDKPVLAFSCGGPGQDASPVCVNAE